MSQASQVSTKKDHLELNRLLNELSSSLSKLVCEHDEIQLFASRAKARTLISHYWIFYESYSRLYFSN